MHSADVKRKRSIRKLQPLNVFLNSVSKAAPGLQFQINVVADKFPMFRVSMATGNGEAPDGNGTRQCGVSDFSPRCEDPNTSPVVATESGPCEGSSRAAPGFRTYKRRKRPVKSSSTTRSRREVTANTEGMAQLETQVSIVLLRPTMWRLLVCCERNVVIESAIFSFGDFSVE